MNTTNRALNRTFLLVVGILLLAAGAAAIALAVIPGWAKAWKSFSATLGDTVGTALKNTAFSGTEHSWILFLVPVAALILVILFLAFILRQGRGRSHALLGAHDKSLGGSSAPEGVVIDATVAEKLIGDALAEGTDLLASAVSTYRIRGGVALKITASPRRGMSPHDVQRSVEQTVTAWDGLLGRELPVLVHINGGLRTKVAKATRTQ